MHSYHSPGIPVHPLHRWRRFAPATALILLGCGAGGASKNIERLQSWRATIDLADTARVKGWITPRYASQLRDRAREEIGASRRTASSEKTTPAERDSVTAAVDSLERSLVNLQRAGP